MPNGTARGSDRGLVRWLRPAFQHPGCEQIAAVSLDPGERETLAIANRKLAWPKTLPKQVKALRDALAQQPVPVDTEQLARVFSRAQTRKVQELPDTLQPIGQVRKEGGRPVVGRLQEDGANLCLPTGTST
ncbi:MAG: hypothetical protein R3E46_00760 [Sedimenticolaceae bacterium]